MLLHCAASRPPRTGVANSTAIFLACPPASSFQPRSIAFPRAFAALNDGDFDAGIGTLSSGAVLRPVRAARLRALQLADAPAYGCRVAPNAPNAPIIRPISS